MTNRMFRPNWPVLTLLLLAAIPFAASAFTIHSGSVVGSVFDGSRNLPKDAWGPLGDINDTGFDLSDTATFGILSKSNTEINFELTLANTNTAAPTDDDLGLRAFGFGKFVRVASWNNAGGRGSNKTASVGAGGSAGFGGASVGGRPIQVVASTDDGNAAPQASQGIAPGESDTFEFQLKAPDTIDLTSPPIPLDPFVAQIGPDNPDNPGGNNPGGPSGNSLITAADIPTPGTLALALIGLFFGRRWFNRQA